MQNRHNMVLSTHEAIPVPGQREILYPCAKLSHQQRSACAHTPLQCCHTSREVP